MSVKIDLKKFKHVSSDDKSTILEHADGHQLKIAHGKLSKEFQQQLDALKGSDKEKSTEVKPESSTKMAEGGLLDKVGTYLDNAADKISGQDKQPKAKKIERGPASEKVKKYGFDQAFADGGEVGSLTEEDLKFDPFKETHVPSSADRFEALKNDPELDRIATAGQMFDMGTQLPPEAKEQMAIDQLIKEKSDTDASAAWRNVDKSAEAMKLAEENKKLQAAGLPTKEMPAEPQATPVYTTDAQGNPIPQPTSEGISPLGQPSLGGQPAAQPTQPQSSPGSFGVDKQIAGINAEAKVAGDLAQAQNAILEKQMKDSLELQNDFKSKFDAINAERKALEQDIKDGHVDPNKYWTGNEKGEGSHSKIMSAIGMIIAGFQPMGGPNAAINFLEKQMEANLQSQKANLDSKESLLKANMQQFGNLKDAMEATRIQQRDMATLQLQQAVNSVQSPLAKAKAMQEIGKLQAENAKATQKFAGQLTLTNMMNEANKDPSKIDGYMQTLKAYDPKQWAEMSDMLVPGKGFATTKEGAKVVRESQQVTDTVKDGINQLRGIMRRPVKSLSPNDRAEAETVRSALVGALRVPITGPGAMNEGERELLMSIIPDVTSMTSLDTISAKKLDALEQRIESSYNNTLKANGLHVPQQMSKQQKSMMSEKGRQDALNWAKANPQDKRSAAILKALGQ